MSIAACRVAGFFSFHWEYLLLNICLAISIFLEMLYVFLQLFSPVKVMHGFGFFQCVQHPVFICSVLGCILTDSVLCKVQVPGNSCISLACNERQRKAQSASRINSNELS